MQGTAGQKEGQGTRVGETGGATPRATSPASPLSYILGSWENPLRECVPELKPLDIAVNSVVAERT